MVEPLGKIGDPETKTSSWKSHFDVNFFSLLYTVQATVDALRSNQHSGRVIAISSGSAVGGVGAMGAYNASKAALNSFIRYLSSSSVYSYNSFRSFGRTLGSEEPNIVSVALRPGMVDTPVSTIYTWNVCVPQRHTDADFIA